LKLVIWSDIQFNNWLEFSTILPNGFNSRFQDQLDVQREIFEYSVELAKNYEVMLIHTGDLFESATEKIDKALFLKVYEEFSKFSNEEIVTILEVGNHDWIDRTETEHIIQPFKKIPNILVVDEPMVQFVEDFALCFIPYTRNNFLGKIEDLKNRCEQKNLVYKYLFTHQGINGAKTGPRDTPMKENYQEREFRPDIFDVIFNGHYHKMQIMGAGLIIVGSGLQKDFGEREDVKGFWVLDTVSHHLLHEETHGPKFYKMEISEDSGVIVLPKGYCSRDFLWVVSEGIHEDKVKEILGEDKNFNPNNTRIEVVAPKVYKARTSISVADPTEDKLKKFIDYFETDLDKEILLRRAIEKYQEAVA